MRRGRLGFEVTIEGDLVDNAANVELLRRLWLDRSTIWGNDLGEGDPGDFDHGAWHIACHLAAAAGVCLAADGRLLWLEVTHNSADDTYYATVSAQCDVGIETWRAASAEGRTLLQGATVLGFVEGNSVGRTSARVVHDPPTRFNLWRRQDFDQPVDSTMDGGKVWEHWCTTRDIRPSSVIGTSVLTAYVSLVARLGDLFPAVVARGRNDYAHPVQLCAMVHGGFVGERSAVTGLSPSALPAIAEELLRQATPKSALGAVRTLDWSAPPRYYMSSRRIDRWCPSAVIRDQLGRSRAG